MTLYDRIGQGYDTTRRADPAIARRLADHLQLQPSLQPDRRYLDVACGTGNYTTALAATGARLYGVDRSRRMLATARTKDPTVAWLLGDVAAMPFRDNSFSGALCTLAIHHFRSLQPVFREVARVLRHEGRFVIFTTTPEQTRGYWLAEYFPDAMARSVDQLPSLESIRHDLASAGLRVAATDPYDVQPDLQDFFLYSGKHRPEIYLEPRVRAGISTFASLADPTEVHAGCTKLADDIQSGRIADVIAAHRHDHGDYLFIIAEA